jgi:hypothetical protein
LNSRANNRKAIVFTLVSMAAFSIEDAFIKHLSSTHSIAQILIVIGLASAIFFAILALKNGRIIWASGLWTRLTFTRMLAEAFAGVAFGAPIHRGGSVSNFAINCDYGIGLVSR